MTSSSFPTLGTVTASSDYKTFKNGDGVWYNDVPLDLTNNIKYASTATTLQVSFGRVPGAVLAIAATSKAGCKNGCNNGTSCAGVDVVCTAKVGAPEWVGQISSVQWKAAGYQNSASAAANWYMNGYDATGSSVWGSSPCVQVASSAPKNRIWPVNGYANARLRFAPVNMHTCSFASGDGSSESERRIKNVTSEAACEKQVKEDWPKANGATVSNNKGSKICIAEFNQTGSKSSSVYRTCRFENKDTVVPKLQFVSINSSNVNRSIAKAGDIITITIRSDEPLKESKVIMTVLDGACTTRAAKVANVYRDSHWWTGTYKMQPTDAKCSGRNIAFRVTFADMKNHPGKITTSTTDKTAVKLDLVVPQMLKIAPSNKGKFGATNAEFKVVLTTNEPILRPWVSVTAGAGDGKGKGAGASNGASSTCQADPIGAFEREVVLFQGTGADDKLTNQWSAWYTSGTTTCV